MRGKPRPWVQPCCSAGPSWRSWEPVAEVTMAGEPVPPPAGREERETRLTLIRKQAEQFGRVDGSGVRPPGAPFPHASPETGYYGIPLLKPPQWTWEIPLYFFVGGAAGSSAVISSVADWIGADPKL